MYKIRLSNGKTFEAAGTDSIINEALAAGVVLEYSCSSGRCSACRASVVNGSTVALSPELGLTEAERSLEEVLLCCRKASSDLVLSVADLGGRMPPPRRLLPARIKSIKSLSTDVIEVILRVPPTSKLDFLPGQYVNISSRGKVGRSYSLASSPKADGKLELLIRNVSGGAMSQYWFSEAKENDLLQVSGPLGSFYMRDVLAPSIIFIATGTGIAPVKSMLEEMAALPPEERTKEIYLFWGGRTNADLFLDLSHIDLQIRYVPVLSRADADWNGARGYVQDAVMAMGIDLSNSVVYACGSPAMIASSRERLSAEGLDPHNFHSDAFVASSL
jgi:CDP-4-dehydro-6-deoxyglucose reductase